MTDRYPPSNRIIPSQPEARGGAVTVGHRKPLQLAENSRPAYNIGYGKTPVATRFQPGQSGNLRGRPRGSKNKLPALNEERLKTIILEEAYRNINVREGERNVSISMATAILRTLAVSAVKGNNRAAHIFTSLLQITERENRALCDEFLGTAIDYKNWWENELRQRKRLGLTGPEPLPHPDHVIIDMNTGMVRITGPMTKEDKAKWDMFRDRKKECDAEIAELLEVVHNTTDPKRKKALEQDLDHERRIRAIICQLIPD